MTLGRHHTNPLERDMEDGWDGVVRWSRETRQFIRVTDRNGDRWEPIVPMLLSDILPHVKFFGVVPL